MMSSTCDAGLNEARSDVLEEAVSAQLSQRFEEGTHPVHSGVRV